VASRRMCVCLIGLVTLLAACKENGTGPTAPCGMGSTCSGSQQLASLTLSPAHDTLLVGDQAQITFAATNSAGASVTGITVVYKSSDTAVAKVDTTGLVKAISAGNTTITIAAGGLKASSQLAVLNPAVVLLSAGHDYSCLVLVLGRGYCWGRNDIGQLGVSVSTSCFDSAGGSAVPCARTPVRIAPGMRLTAISAGGDVACALNNASAAYCWADNTFGELGSGVAGGGGGSPTAVAGAIIFASIAAGNQHACGVGTGARLFCWGDDDFGQLGDTGIVNSTSPIPVDSAGVPMSLAGVTTGSAHTCALKAGGAAYCWGNNEAGQLGIGSTDANAHSTPVQVTGGLVFASLTAGTIHTCGLTSAGVAYCWGDNTSGEIGNGTTGGPLAAPVAVGGGLTFTELTAGDGFTCGVSGGAAYCWGSNSDGQIGQGANVLGGNITSPAKVTGALTFTYVSAGARHVCGIVAGGAAACWGSNLFGALGNALQAGSSGVPVIVGTPLS
jgi:alpha-tubulin suppressor-like RCC1 family protein